LVLDSQKQAIEAMRPGKAFLSVHMLAAKVLTEGLIDMGIFKGDAAEMVNAGAHALLFPHGLGHAMGLDVHDLEEFGEDKVGYDDTIKRSDIFGLKNLRFGKEMQANMV
jgi:metallopeptidase family M24.